MEQLTLDVKLPVHAVFSTFVPNGNEMLLASLFSLSKRPESGETILFSGPDGVGKTHILYALCQAIDVQQQSVYLDLANPSYTPEVLHGWEHCDLICLDNIERIANIFQWEEALFDLFNRRLNKANGKKSSLVMSTNLPLVELSVALKDLRSRLSSGLMYQVKPLADKHLSEVLQLQARQRGMTLPSEVSEYLIRRLPREASALVDVVKQLDKASLQAKRKLTIPFVKSVLD